jgi:uncharacterized protein (DUF488 family)
MPVFCYSLRVVVHTVGHSTLALADFLALLEVHRIKAIADVRRWPASRRHPHFGREALERSLAAAGVAYLWIPELGGRRAPRPDSPHVAWRNPSFRAYADHMETPEFAAGFARLLALAAEQPTAVMCAEAVPWRCHRQLIADALVARQLEVRHVTGPSSPSPHRLSADARLEGTRIVYDGGQGSLAGR